MAESKVKRENFIALQGWQVTDLGLKGNELIIYACIYGFSQDDQTFSGSLQYLADWTNSTKQGVIKCLKSLQEKGYIEKKENYINGVKFCEYYATKFNRGMQQSLIPIKQSLTGGMQQSLTNNIGLDNITNTIDKKIDYQRIVAMYNDTCVSFPKITTLSDARKKAIKARLNTYTYNDFEILFSKAEASDFLKGKNGRDWRASFDWLIKDANMAKVLDGNYDNKGQAQTASEQQKQLEAYMLANAAQNQAEDTSLYDGLI
jgi:hypothetical protein